MLQGKFDPRFFRTQRPSDRHAPAEHHGGGIYLSCVVSALMVLGLDLNLPLGVAVAMLYSAVVLLALRSRNKWFIIGVTIVASLFTLGPLLFKEPVDGMWKVASNRTLALISMWIACYLGLQRQATEEKRELAFRERERAFEEVRILRGFLPICSSCKKIRSLEGSWTLLERYITDHSEAEFSHGLCPECTRKLFPQFFDEETDRHTGGKS